MRMKFVTAHGHSPRSMPLRVFQCTPTSSAYVRFGGQLNYVDFREGFQFLNIGGCFKFSSVGI